MKILRPVQKKVCRSAAAAPQLSHTSSPLEAFALGSLAGVVACLLCTACATEMVCRRPNGPPQPSDCVQQGGPGAAAAAAAANAVVWTSGSGCELAGCHPTMTCNRRTGLCERPVCGEGAPACPLGTVCDAATLRCR